MSILVVLMIMVAAGLLGGWINYLLPANEKDGLKIRRLATCMVLGTGATMLVPLFLEIAQSKLLDDLHFGWQRPAQLTAPVLKQFDTAAGKADTSYLAALQQSATVTEAAAPRENAKHYLLFSAYCLVAAAAGFRFIDGVINSVLKEKENAQLRHENQDLKKETEKRQANSQISQQQEEREVQQQLIAEKTEELQQLNDPEAARNFSLPVLPTLPPITHPDDPQKGRFGGRAENNGRRLRATVSASNLPNFYRVQLIVESTDAERPLQTDVIFYLHDSFSPSVFTYKPSEFREGRAMENELLSYGAFTVGVITDNGQTLLELDLAENKDFPKEFRER